MVTGDSFSPNSALWSDLIFQIHRTAKLRKEPKTERSNNSSKLKRHLCSESSGDAAPDNELHKCTKMKRRHLCLIQKPVLCKTYMIYIQMAKEKTGYEKKIKITKKNYLRRALRFWSSIRIRTGWNRFRGPGSRKLIKWKSS